MVENKTKSINKPKPKPNPKPKTKGKENESKPKKKGKSIETVFSSLNANDINYLDCTSELAEEDYV